jgi:hypothetical protein
MTASSNAQRKDSGAAGGGAGAATDPRRKDFALIIGIDHYRHLEKLNGAINDAQRFRDWLLREDGGNVPPGNVRFAPSQPDRVCPVKDQIDNALEDLIRAAKRNHGGRRLYFHFSGHGAGRELIDDVALLLAEWPLTGGGRALSADKYKQRLIGLHVFEEIVVLLDCCRRTARSAPGLGPKLQLEPGPGCSTMHFVAYATENDGFAYEDDRDGTWQGELTRCLLDILYAHGGISAPILKQTLVGRLKEKGRRAQVIDDLSPDSTFGPRGPLPILEIIFQKAVGNVTLVARDHGPPVSKGTWPVTPTPLRLSLPNGFYRLEDSEDKRMVIEHEGQVETTPDGVRVVTRITF